MNDRTQECSLMRGWRQLSDYKIWFIGAAIVVWTGLVTNIVNDIIKYLTGQFVDSHFTCLSEMAIKRGVSGLILLLFGLLCYWFIEVKRETSKPRTRPTLKGIEPPKKPYLVIFLSDGEFNKRITIKNDGSPSNVTLTGDILKDLEALVSSKQDNGNWPWEMPLRAIGYHAGRLKEVLLVCSPESLKQLNQFVKLIRKYTIIESVEISIVVKAGKDFKVVAHGAVDADCRGIYFEDFDEISIAIDTLISYLDKRRVSKSDIIIDITGGQKVPSAAGAAMTFNSDIKVQYVSTHDYKVKSYDIVYLSDETGALGFG